MISSKQVVEALEAWAADVTDCTAYGEQPEQFNDAFPFVTARIVREEEYAEGQDFPEQQYQQLRVEDFNIEITVLVDPEPQWDAHEPLYEIVDALKAALRDDETLGGRVQQASRRYLVNYPGEAQLSDGTRALIARMRFSVAQVVEA